MRRSGFKMFEAINCVFGREITCMRPGGTVECQRKIESFLNQEPESLARLRELLPFLFDSHRVFTTEGQMELLKACSLVPIRQTVPFHQVTFLPCPGEEPLTSSPRQERARRRQGTRLASETSRPSSGAE